MELILNIVRTVQEWRVARFVMSGGMSAATSLSILFVLTHWYGVWYLYSSIVAACTATIVSFVLQKLWTFQNFSTAVHKQFPLHATLALSNIAVNTASMYVLVEYLSVWYLIAQVLTGGALACVNYFVYKHVIFPKDVV